MYRELNGFSPRNGEVILKAKYKKFSLYATSVSVPAMVDVNSTVCYLRTDIWTWGKDTIILPTPQWGSNPKVKYIPLMVESVAFQSPQWGSNPKDEQDQHPI